MSNVFRRAPTSIAYPNPIIIPTSNCLSASHQLLTVTVPYGINLIRSTYTSKAVNHVRIALMYLKYMIENPSVNPKLRVTNNLKLQF